MSNYSMHVDESQAWDSYRIKKAARHSSPKSSDAIAPTRIYVPGGIDGISAMQKALELGLDISQAKVWAPPVQDGEISFRKDTPILTVESCGQLANTLQLLQHMYFHGDLRLDPNGKSSIGLQAASLPGVYVGQNSSISFTGEMSELFGSAITHAAKENPLYPGEAITDDWLSKTATKTQEIATFAAAQRGYDSSCHALLSGQPIEDIKRIVET